MLGNKNIEGKGDNLKAIKRDGRVKEFDIKRIETAIDLACDEVGESIKVSDVAKEVVERLENKNDKPIEIEIIQDTILKVLYKTNRKVYKAYKDYRQERNEIRIKKSKKEKFYSEILGCNNVDNDNANVDQYSFSGRKYRIADTEQKEYALRHFISKEVREGIEESRIYQHDLSSYSIGEHNCLFSDNYKLLTEGFETRNGDVRPAGSFSTACQLLAVIFQIQSQNQFGGVASIGIDFELEPFVKMSFFKKYVLAIVKDSDDFIELNIEDMNENELDDFVRDNYQKYLNEYGLKKEDVTIENKENLDRRLFQCAYFDLMKEGRQSAQGLFHNLNTLESRAGSQVPFTSLNFGRNTSIYGRLINRWILNASIEGIGRFNRTSIFPIGIFQYKKGTNANKGDINYDLKRKAIESMSKRIYPNWANGDWKQNIEDPNDYRTFFGTMGKQDCPFILVTMCRNQLNC